MKISEMNDNELWRAIAEKLGYCKHFGGTEVYYRGEQEAKGNIWRCRECDGIIIKPSDFPNYPCDPAAALALPLETNDEKRRFAQELGKILTPDMNIGIAAIIYEARFATARQHSEAWLNMRRNDG